MPQRCVGESMTDRAGLIERAAKRLKDDLTDDCSCKQCREDRAIVDALTTHTTVMEQVREALEECACITWFDEYELEYRPTKEAIKASQTLSALKGEQ